MTISVSQKQLQSIKQMCQEATVLKITRVLGQLTSTILAIVSAKHHCRFV